MRPITTRSYAAKRSCSVAPGGASARGPSPVVIQRAKTGLTSIRATVRQADPQVTGDCWIGPMSPLRNWYPEDMASSSRVGPQTSTATPAVTREVTSGSSGRRGPAAARSGVAQSDTSTGCAEPERPVGLGDVVARHRPQVHRQPRRDRPRLPDRLRDVPAVQRDLEGADRAEQLAGQPQVAQPDVAAGGRLDRVPVGQQSPGPVADAVEQVAAVGRRAADGTRLSEVACARTAIASRESSMWVSRSCSTQPRHGVGRPRSASVTRTRLARV